MGWVGSLINCSASAGSNALPVRSRYRFMLEEAQFTLMGFIKGPVCRGQVALDVIEDRFWINALPQQGVMFNFPPAEPFEPDRWLDDGDTVQIGHCELEVRHCPGHTPGHVVFFERETKTAFVGDVIFAGSIGRTDFPRGDYAALVDSIVSKLWPLGDDVRFVPGHGPESTFGHERRHNPYVGGT